MPSPYRKASYLHKLQYVLRGVQLCCTALVLAIYSYFLATLANNSMTTPTYVRAVEGISGVATLYVVLAVLALRFGARMASTLLSFVFVAFDFIFVWCFVYVATANRGGAGSCDGDVDTPLGQGDGDDVAEGEGDDAILSLPKLSQACQLLSACLAVSIVVIFFFIFTILAEVAIGRQRHRLARYGIEDKPPARVSADEPMASGALGPGDPETAEPATRAGGLSRWWKSIRAPRSDENRHDALPQHAQPDEIHHVGTATDLRDSYHSEAPAHELPDSQQPLPYAPPRPGYADSSRQTSHGSNDSRMRPPQPAYGEHGRTYSGGSANQYSPMPPYPDAQDGQRSPPPYPDDDEERVGFPGERREPWHTASVRYPNYNYDRY